MSRSRRDRHPSLSALHPAVAAQIARRRRWRRRWRDVVAVAQAKLARRHRDRAWQLIYRAERLDGTPHSDAVDAAHLAATPWQLRELLNDGTGDGLI